jgi:hypothetical protein
VAGEVGLSTIACYRAKILKNDRSGGADLSPLNPRSRLVRPAVDLDLGIRDRACEGPARADRQLKINDT